MSLLNSNILSNSFHAEFKKLKGPRRIKAKVAIWILERFPPKPSKTRISTVRKKLNKWAARANWPVTIHPSAIRQKNELNIPNMMPDGSVNVKQSGKRQLALSENFSAMREDWDSFLYEISGTKMQTTGPEVRKQTLSIISTGSGVRVVGDSAMFDIVHVKQDGLALMLDDLIEHQWLLFARPEDTLRADLLDRFENTVHSKTQIAIPDIVLAKDDQVYPVLAPGANYVYALNCQFYTTRFFARVGAVRAAVGRGATTADEIALDLLRANDLSTLPPSAQAVGLPMIETPGDLNSLVRLRADLLRMPDVRLPSPNGPVLSHSVDTSEMGGVSVVICTKNKGFYIRQLVARLLDYPEQIVRDIIIVSNNTTNFHALDTLQSVAQSERVTLLRYESKFNFSAQSNLGADQAIGEFILFLNDDIIPIAERWLEELMIPFIDPKTVATGPLLLYPDERVQHAGMVLGHGQVAGHIMAGHCLPDQEFNFLCSIPRYVACVTGAVLMVRKADFDAVGGFDISLRLWIQDVDLCMRLSCADGRIVLNPRSTLFHMESLSVRETLEDVSIGQARGRERDHFFCRWPNFVDYDSYHPHLLDVSALNCRLMSL